MAEQSQITADRIPSYTITRRQDLSFQFNPPVGSVELANALAFKYPLEPNLETQLRRALLDRLESENIISSTIEQRHLGNYTPKATSTNDGRAPTKNWKITTGNPALHKKKRSPYTNDKRKKVSEVRKRGACENHRTKKLETTTGTPQLVLDNSQGNKSGEPTIARATVAENGFEGTYDFNSFLRNSAADPTWNDIFQQTPANHDQLNDPWWWSFENFSA
ncbi:hypothetical protein N431DRAFT_554813 [Stipitochalara longipes BDJ]|nr:hypothetical protein N431DRAFT_554813 [Stipitochalara longipes BDJ]